MMPPLSGETNRPAETDVTAAAPEIPAVD